MKKASSKYIFILGILTVVILGSQILMQTTIKSSKSDARIINISGRQRMLSQKITKASLKLLNADNSQKFEGAKKELDEAFVLWNQSHEDLQYGSEEIDVSVMNRSNELKLLYDDIEPYYLTIKASASNLVTLKFEDLSTDEGIESIHRWVAEISKNESSFLTLMNKITFQYDRQASDKIEQLSVVEMYLMALTFVLILLEAFFIFRPMYADTKQKTVAISELSELRSEEKVYAANQIIQANQRIKSLKQVALKLKSELEFQSDQYATRLNEQMSKYTTMAEEYEKVKGQTDFRKLRALRLEEKGGVEI